MAKETELKLVISSDYGALIERILDRLGARHRGRSELFNAYYDTSDRDLSARKMALRVRRKGSAFIQTLKTAGTSGAGGLSHRGEWEWELDNEQLCTPCLAGLIPDELANAEFYPQYQTDFERTLWLLNFTGSEIEIAWDQGTIKVGDQIEMISELELELKSGNTKSLLVLAKQLSNLLPVRAGVLSKAARAERLRSTLRQGLAEDDFGLNDELSSLSHKLDIELETLCSDSNELVLSAFKNTLDRVKQKVKNLQFSSDTLELIDLLERIQQQTQVDTHTATEIARWVLRLIESRLIGQLSTRLALINDSQPAEQ